MTQPGTTGNAIPRGRDWIARDLADLRRMIRRLGASASTAGGGAPLAAGSYLTSGTTSVPATLTLVTEVTTFGDLTPYFALDSPGVDCLVTGWYQAAAYAQISGVTAGGWVSIGIDGGSIDAVTAYGIASSGGDVSLYVTTIPFYSTSGRPLNIEIDGGTGTAHICFLDVVKLPD